jgi:hypothetical protein
MAHGRRVVLLLGALLVLGGALRSARACRGPFPTLEQAIERASLVVVGQVDAVVDDGPFPQLPSSRRLRIRLRVEQTLKGRAGALVEILADTTTCGIGNGIEVGQRWLVLAAGAPLSTNAISLNQLLLSEADKKRAVESVKAALAARAKPR